MSNVYIHPTAIIGARVVIGDGTSIREYVVIYDDCKIGKNCSINLHAHLTIGTIVGDHVFIGPGVITTNTKRIWHKRQHMQLPLRQPPIIGRGARIGAGAIILPGVVIGEQCFVGAGSVVTKDTKPFHQYVGSPARDVGRIPEDEIL